MEEPAISGNIPRMVLVFSVDAATRRTRFFRAMFKTTTRGYDSGYTGSRRRERLYGTEAKRH
jgi:hypothetical protein